MNFNDFVGMQLPERDWAKVLETKAFIVVGKEAYETAGIGVKEQNKEKAMFIIPTIVNLSFAIELYMKSYINKKIENHYLDGLFKEMPEKIQNLLIAELIENHGVTSAEEFNQKLKDVRRVFIDWRYFYEHKESQMVIDLEFLNLLLFAISSLDVLWENDDYE